MTTIEVNGLRKRFGPSVALDGMTFVVHPGHVTGFVGPNGKPVPLTEQEINALGVEKKEIVVNYAVGDMVHITDGPLENFSGVVEQIDREHGSVRVTISMFGRETSVDLELDQVESLED